MKLEEAIRLLEYVKKQLDELIDVMWEILEGYESERVKAWREKVLQMRRKVQGVR